MNEDKDANNPKSMEAVRKDEAEALLSAIQGALEDGPDNVESFVNEFGDFTIAISLGGDEGSLDRFMEKQKLNEDLTVLTRWLASQLAAGGKQDITCCFTGRRPKKVEWLADEDDYRMRRLRGTLQAVVKGLALGGVKRFIAGNAEGFDTIGAEAVLGVNGELDTMKEIGVLSGDWESVELEIAIPFEGHNAHNRRTADVREAATVAHVVSRNPNRTQAFFERNEYMVDHADMVIALLDDKGSDSATGGTASTITYAKQQGKPVMTFYATWFEDGWPDVNGMDLWTPPEWIDALNALGEQGQQGSSTPSPNAMAKA